MDTKRIFSSYGIYVSFALALFLILQEGINTGLILVIKDKLAGSNVDNYTTIELYALTLFYSSFILFAPLIASLPFSGSYIEDYRNNYICNILSRSDKKSYILSKIAHVSIAGFISVFVPLIIYGIFCRIIAVPIDTQNWEHISDLQVKVWSIINTNGGFVYIFVQSFIIGLYGSAWALVSLMISAYIPNKLATYILPLVICYFMNLAFGALDMRIFSPYQSIDPSIRIFSFINAYQGFAYMIGYQLIVSAIASILFFVGFNRRFSHV